MMQKTKIKRTVFSFISLSLATLLLGACSYQPEDAGQCALVCGNSIITGNDQPVSISLKTPIVQTECATALAGTAVGPFRTGFLVGEAILDQSGNPAGVRPVPNISIEPLLIGNRPIVNNENDADTRYRGLLTLKQNWCSDSCGVVMLDTIGQCPGVSGSDELTIQIHSGALFSDPASFPITTKAPDQ